MAIVHGIVPADVGKFGREYVLVRELGWTWEDVMRTPAIVADEFYIRIQAESKARQRKREIDEALSK